MPATCANCGATLSPGFRYCPECTQSVHLHRLNLKHILHEVFHFFTHADKGILYLLKMLALAPGKVIREYIGGKRKKYFPPLTFFFIVIGLFVFFINSFHTLEGVDLKAAKQQVAQIPDPVVRERRLKKLERVEQATGFMAKHSNIINFVVTPVAALIFFLFYARSGYNYTEHLVANLYISGFNGLLYILIVVPISIIARGTPQYMLGIILFFIAESGYRAVAYYRFMNKKGALRFLYAVFCSLLITVGWYLLSSSLVTYYINQGF